MSLKYFLNLHHFSNISRAFLEHFSEIVSECSALPQKTLDISRKISDVSPKTWEIFQKTLDFFQKTSEFFFQSPPREDFSQQIGTQKKQEMEAQQA